ncbi:MAG: replicative DNA helicase, partial [Clostridia bacterium]
NYKHYVEIVKRDSVLRKLISSGQKIIENSYGAEDKETAIAFAEKEVYDIAEKEDQSSLEHISGAINAVIEKLDMIAKDGESMKGLSTGFDDLDEVTNGLHGSDLILIAARPGVGKTSLAMNIINNVAINEKAKCAVFSLEMPRTQIAQRSLFSVSSVSMGKGLKGNLTSEEWKSVWLAKKQISEAAIYVDDSSMNTPVDILSKCRRLKRESGLDLVMIDYLQLMNGSGKAKDNRQQEISEITRSLKIAAKELNVPIIVLSQLSRSVEARKDHRPMLSDLRESGAIEQDADIVMFIYKADMYNDVVSEDEPGVCELIIAKHRNGSLATVKLKWIGELTKFVGLHDKTFKASPAKNIEKSKPTEQNSPILEEIPAEDLENLDDLW